ncbi:MAG TPA: SRPBCC family protein [Woeseiaceae bacterium]
MRTHRFHAGGTETWTVSNVNHQDWNMWERVQRGMHARPFMLGNYAPMEDMSLDIRHFIAERLGNDLPPD